MATKQKPLAFAALHDPLEAELHKQHTEILCRSNLEGKTKRTSEWVKDSVLILYFEACLQRKRRLRRWRRLLRGLDPLAAATLLPIVSQRGPAALRLLLPPKSLSMDLLARVRTREQRARRLSNKVCSSNA